MMILSVDQSVTRSGWAVVESTRLMRGATVLHSGWFACKAEREPDRVRQFEDQVEQLILDYRPDMLVWEQPLQFITRNQGRGVNASQLVLVRLDQVMLFLADRFDLLHDSVAPASWRSKILGKGAGHLPRKEAKRRALIYCDWLALPVAEDDVAEAVCIGLWAATCSKVLEKEAWD